jgi:hypothetical protein
MSYKEKQLFQREIAILETLSSDLSLSEDHKTVVNNQLELYKRAIKEINRKNPF